MQGILQLGGDVRTTSFCSYCTTNTFYHAIGIPDLRVLFNCSFLYDEHYLQ